MTLNRRIVGPKEEYWAQTGTSALEKPPMPPRDTEFALLRYPITCMIHVLCPTKWTCRNLGLTEKATCVRPTDWKNAITNRKKKNSLDKKLKVKNILKYPKTKIVCYIRDLATRRYNSTKSNTAARWFSLRILVSCIPQILGNYHNSFCTVNSCRSLGQYRMTTIQWTVVS